MNLCIKHLFKYVCLCFDQGEDEEGEEGEEKLPTCSDYVMHFFTLFWKILFAFVPPTGKLIFIDKKSFLFSLNFVKRYLFLNLNDFLSALSLLHTIPFNNL